MIQRPDKHRPSFVRLGTWMIFAAILTGCATCKSSDTIEQCRTKQRDKSQRLSVQPLASARGTERA